MKSDINVAEDRYLKLGDSEEFASLQGGKLTGYAEHRAFATKGDSGSVVWDEQGRAVGLLFRGRVVQQTDRIVAYITPINDVFEDIMKFSQGSIKEIRIARAGK